MDEFQDMVFCSEIVLQIKIARKAYERLTDCQSNIDHVEVWCSIQSILVSAANVSKILNPSEKKYKPRGKRLCNKLNVKEDFIILNRKFRNSFFEHYDSRIEEWFQCHGIGSYIDQSINPKLAYPNLNTHRGYNYFDNTIVFRGECLKLDLIFREMDHIYENCKLYTLP